MHVQLGNEPVSISIENRERRGCSASIRRSRVTDELVNNTTMVADRIAVANEIPMVGWQAGYFLPWAVWENWRREKIVASLLLATTSFAV